MRTTLNIEDKLLDKAAKLTGINEKTSRIPANHVDNLTATEREISIHDVRRVVVELGISSEKEVDQTIIGWTRDSGFYYGSDAFTAINQIIIESSKSLKIQNRFEALYGVPIDKDTLCTHALGGVFLDEDQANLPRSDKDLKLDEERREELAKQREASERSYIREHQMAEDQLL